MVRDYCPSDNVPSIVVWSLERVNDLPNGFRLAALMSTVYEEQKDEDGFLYVQYSGESTFGSEIKIEES